MKTPTKVPEYDFNTELDEGFKLALQLNPDLEPDGIFTCEMKYQAEANPKFKWPTPRIEIETTPGAALGHWVMVEGKRRSNGWGGTLAISVITGPDQTEHSAFVSAVRKEAAILDQTLGSDTDATLLPYHQVAQLKSAGETDMMKVGNGFFVTILNFDFIFNIRPSVWGM